MVRHIVLFTLGATDADQRSADLAEMKSRLESLRGVVTGVTSIEVHGDLGEVDGHWHAALVSEHDDVQALAAYQAHPRHREVVAWLDTVVTGRATVDHTMA